MEAREGNKEIRDDAGYIGYQACDLEDELLEEANPTPTRRAKHYFLQVAAHHGRVGSFLARS